MKNGTRIMALALVVILVLSILSSLVLPFLVVWATVFRQKRVGTTGKAAFWLYFPSICAKLYRMGIAHITGPVPLRIGAETSTGALRHGRNHEAFYRT